MKNKVLLFVCGCKHFFLPSVSEFHSKLSEKMDNRREREKKTAEYNEQITFWEVT